MAGINGNYGGFWIRFLAYVVDSLIVGIAFFLIVMLLGVMGLELFGAELIFLLLGILYWAFMQSSARQATYGKSLVGLRVIGLAGERITVGRALAREVAKIVSTLTLLIGYIIAAFTKRKQALHDFVASTYVVRVAPGQIVVALAVTLVALLAPFAVVFMFGAGVLAGMGGMAGALMSGPEITMQTPKPPAPPSPPLAKPRAIQAPAPAAPVAKPVAVSVAAPKPEPAKPAALVIAQAPEQPAPAAEPAKPVAKKQRAKPAVAAEEKPQPAEAPRKAAQPMTAPMQTAAAPAGTPMRFNDLVTAVLYRDAAAVNELLAFGKWPDKPDSRGMTPLMLAAMLGDAPIAEALLKAGANPNLSGAGGETAMSLAREGKHTGVVGLLRQHGAR
jgi:uncharacterized RDD family membrane protein YckC